MMAPRILSRKLRLGNLQVPVSAAPLRCLCDASLHWSFALDGRKKWLSIAAILGVAVALLLSGCGAPVANQALPADTGGAPTQEDGTAQPGASPEWDLATQRNAAGRVEINMTPLTLDGDTWEFEIAISTHSVDLNFDLTEVGVLRCDQGQEFQPTAWAGPGPGGHHRSGVLQFAALDHPSSFVEIVIRDVASVPERVFRWDVPGAAAAPVALSVDLHPASETDKWAA